jgi:hypothetical protein
MGTMDICLTLDPSVPRVREQAGRTVEIRQPDRARADNCKGPPVLAMKAMGWWVCRSRRCQLGVADHQPLADEAFDQHQFAIVVQMAGQVTDLEPLVCQAGL